MPFVSGQSWNSHFCPRPDLVVGGEIATDEYKARTKALDRRAEHRSQFVRVSAAAPVYMNVSPTRPTSDDDSVYLANPYGTRVRPGERVWLKAVEGNTVTGSVEVWIER